MSTIVEKIQHIHQQIDEACRSAGRPVGSVALLAVSKTFGVDAIAEAIAAGQRAFGENYIQEGVEKIGYFGEQPAFKGMGLIWHCIGPVQSNKTRLVAEHFDWVHTVDRLKIAQRLSDQRPAHLAPLQVCIQVNVDGGATKSGVAPAEVEALVREMARLPNLVLRGLMSVPDVAPDFDAQLAVHQRAKAAFNDIAKLGLPQLKQWDTLSLGMTADLPAAVQAGSTMVRVGSGIFGSRNYATAG
ncbi:MAG: YggS family pyridoxal phosphate-dependent enzyme [Comamonas sp.]